MEIGPVSKLIPFGRVLFAVALIGLGVDHFVFRKFVAGRAPGWPESLAGGVAWAYLTGGVLIATGIAILIQRHARQAVIFAAALVFVWGLLRHVPVLAASSFLSGAWTDASKAVRFIGGALVVAATLDPGRRRGVWWTRLWLVNRDAQLVTVGRVCLGLTLLLNGSQHFRFTAVVASLIPNWFPGNAVVWTYVTGTALVVFGVGLFSSRTAQWAALASGLMIFSWFFIVHLSRELAGVADGIAIFEVLATAGGLFVIAGALYREGMTSIRRQEGP